MSRERADRVGFVALWLMVVICMVAVFFGIMAALSPLPAHSWYDHVCCSDRDCAPATVGEKDGQLHLSNQFGEAVVPQSLVPRPSKDNQWHACFDYTRQNLRCVYAPAGS